MRKFLFAASALALAAIPCAASAQTYGNVYEAPGAVVVPAPGYYPAPMVNNQVYLAPGQTYVEPGTEYQEQPIYMNGQRYYRDCWWDWGKRKCELKPWW